MIVALQDHKKKIAGGVVGTAAAIALAANVLIYPSEGERHTVYRDVVGMLTVCVGETHNIQIGHVYSHAECMNMLDGRLAEFDKGVRDCTRDDMPTEVEAAALSLAYNIGLGGFCKSTFARKVKAGDYDGACNSLMLYDRAGGREIAGLKNRRARERKVCVEGL